MFFVGIKKVFVETEIFEVVFGKKKPGLVVIRRIVEIIIKFKLLL